MDKYFMGNDKASTQFYSLTMAICGFTVVNVTICVFPGVSAALKDTGSFTLGMSMKTIGWICLAASPTKWCFLASGMLSITGDQMASPNVPALLTKIAPASSYGTCLGVSQTFGSMARVVGPIFYAYLFQSYAHEAPFLTVAATGIVSSILWLAVRQQHALNEQAKEIEQSTKTVSNERAEDGDSPKKAVG